MTREPSPYLTVGALRDLLDGWPGDHPVLVGTVAGTVSRVVYSCHETAEGTDSVAEFRTRARPPAAYLEMPPPLPAPPEPFAALVLRGEASPSVTDARARIELSAPTMRELHPTMRQLLDSGWTLAAQVKPVLEGNGQLVRATFTRGEVADIEARIARTPGLAQQLDAASARPASEFRPQDTGRPRRSTFAEYTTFRLGGAIQKVVTARTDDELINAARDPEAMLVGGGSNLLVGDAGFDGTAVLVRTRGLDIDDELITAAAGENWDDFVAAMLADRRGQLAPLSGIPGSVGATPIQNVGAYGSDVGLFIEHVTVYDRSQQRVRVIPAASCGFGYRDSTFKTDRARYAIVSVTFRLPVCPTVPVAYPQLADALGTEVGQEADAAKVRETVLGLRRSKGMVLDAGDHDSWSAGSFFINPVLPEVPAAAADCPSWPDPAGRKPSAAWLIEHAGFGRGYTLPGGTGRAALSGKHTLALTNRGGATTGEMLELAGAIRAGVRSAFGVTLEPEPLLAGCRLPPEDDLLQRIEAWRELPDESRSGGCGRGSRMRSPGTRAWT